MLESSITELSINEVMLLTEHGEISCYINKIQNLEIVGPDQMLGLLTLAEYLVRSTEDITLLDNNENINYKE